LLIFRYSDSGGDALLRVTVTALLTPDLMVEIIKII
jgi:hypothetical protein